MRSGFDHELDLLQQDLLRMGSAAECALRDATEAVFSRDDALADRVIADDDLIDSWDLEVETRCMKLLALQQPMARDLRTIGSILKIVTDLERIGDHAVDIAKLAKRLNSLPPFKPYHHIPRLLDIVKQMLHESLRAFVDRDIDLVKATCAKDEEVDALYRSIFDEVLEIMEARPEVIRQGVCVILLIRYLERTADHATNIGERTVYIETGELEDLNS